MGANAAEDNQAGIQYGVYQEGKRRTVPDSLQFDPIRVDNLSANGSVSLFERVKFFFNYVQDTWSGATPITTAPLASMLQEPELTSGASTYVEDYLVNADGIPVVLDFEHIDPALGFSLVETPGAIHMLSSASPETRKEGDFGLAYEWDTGAVELGGGLSQEDDYDSRFVSLGGRWDLNRKLTTLSADLSYTDSDISRKFPTDTQSAGFSNGSAYFDPDLPTPLPGEDWIQGERTDWSARLGVSQILDRDSVLETGLGYTRSGGFLENPYKVVTFAFLDPDQPLEPAFPALYVDTAFAIEQRPDLREQWFWDLGYVRHIDAVDAALHLDYHFFHDDWGIDAHTFEAAWAQPLGRGWTLTPRVRYYTQSAADFYQPFFFFEQQAPLSPGGRLDLSKLPRHFSSDHRLSGFGALSGGLTVSKALAGDIAVLEAGFEYYTHQGELKLGGGGEDDYADFNSFLINVGLRVNLDAALAAADSVAGSGSGRHAEEPAAGEQKTRSIAHGHARAPAGVMFDHMLEQAGDFMVGYRYTYHRQSGDTLNGTRTASDARIVAQACPAPGCSVTPAEHTMHMHMVDFTYAPSDWLNLMVMPQFVDMEMDLRPLEGGVVDEFGGHHHGGDGNTGGSHETGGISDTLVVALVKLFEVPEQHLHLGLGLSAPTGDVGQTIDVARGPRPENPSDTLFFPEFIHYQMQLGSGTWDLLPSLTYTGGWRRWSWGGQLSGIKRLEERNESGYALGDQFQATAWTNWQLTPWLAVSVRGLYTEQGDISGEFDGPHPESSPPDLPRNYGGEYWDVGFGLTARVPYTGWQGSRVGIEWLQPVEDDVNGFQLERDGTFLVTWSIAF